MTTETDVAARSEELRQKVSEALEQFRAGKITEAQLKAATKEMTANTRLMRAEIRLLEAAKKLENLNRGRPALGEDEVMKPVSVYMKTSQKEKLQRLGGAPWVRKKIDQAKE